MSLPWTTLGLQCSALSGDISRCWENVSVVRHLFLISCFSATAIEPVHELIRNDSDYLWWISICNRFSNASLVIHENTGFRSVLKLDSLFGRGCFPFFCCIQVRKYQSRVEHCSMLFDNNCAFCIIKISDLYQCIKFWRLWCRLW